ncbi:MAG: hypothetical protein HN828_02640 [Candidatus Thioglobus sp.]|jgi:hypothetical protein|uniref:hypothetical protein n=1 Tax=Candidatus Thioglobus sp. TaxID=2026721 RepID=UPI0001BD3840|nr:hypothetical protein [Candidatus Thioglobus sp.]EEZ79891.1 MAG: hypothetical protein Sup05_0486 [uncultured Candidatus Thioglobus sp.]MBT3186812.1 hypothetical protein [Candidatus Thioglobus sp.]MBT3431393.1 hypothetical protein [Candidatus Thioglobus sp.]MBT3965098.1 hypothetical protein [Candidatus Thioglobus sp.]MBT4316075.1 hypothetical protein [Candidatus Thioglobus sp.]
MKEIQNFILIILLGISINAYAEKSILFQDKTITIYTDNTVIYADGSAPVFKSSSTWVEEDFFTQQDKYCEVDSKYIDKLKKGLKIKAQQ